MEWPEPWIAADESEAEAFAAQLLREVAPGHPMYGLEVKLIARGEGDDMLFEFLDGSGRVAVVHLVFSKAQQPPPWPATVIFQNLDAFIEHEAGL